MHRNGASANINTKYRSQFLDKFVGCSDGYQPHLLGELGKTGIAKQWNMPEELVTNVATNNRCSVNGL